MQKPPSFGFLWPGCTELSQTCTALDPQCVRDLELESSRAALTDG
jgi:hypothetical protein